MANSAAQRKTCANSSGWEKRVLFTWIILLSIASSVSTANASSNNDSLTRFLAPLGAHHQALLDIQKQIDRLDSGKQPQKAELLPIMRALIKESEAFIHTTYSFSISDVRGGLVKEANLINHCIESVDKSINEILRLGHLDADKIFPEVPETEKKIRKETEDIAETAIKMGVTKLLEDHGLDGILTINSFHDARNEMVRHLRRRAKHLFDSKTYQWLGIRFPDVRTAKRAIESAAAEQIETLVREYVLALTGNELVIRFVQKVVLKWVKHDLYPRLREELRPKGNLEPRLDVSLGTLEAARLALHKLGSGARSPADVPLDTVRRALNRATAAQAATKYLERDIKRAPQPRRDKLLNSLDKGKKALETTIEFTKKRFMLTDYNYEVTLLAAKVASAKDYIMAALLEIEKQLGKADPAVGDDVASPSAPVTDAAAPGADPDGSGGGAAPGPDAGPAKVKVPSVDGLPAARAKALITGAGLVPAISVGEAAGQKRQEYTVHSQKPAGGTLLATGAAVSVVIYGAYVDQATAMVPDVVGRSAKDAKSAIADAGFTAAMAMGDGAPDAGSEYIAYSQSPAGGTAVVPGATVSVILYGKYKETMVSVPNVTGLGATEATLRITEAGLVAAKAQGDRAPEATQSNTVQSQDKAAGSRVKEKSTVTLTLYRPCEKNERCNKNQSLYYSAYSAGDYTRCSQILADSRDCAFYSAERSDLEDSKCISADAAYSNAIRARDYSRARSILAQNANCDFYSDHVQSLKCSENLSAITAAYHANDMNRFKNILARSSDCSYYADFVSALRRSQQQRQRNQQLAQAFGQILGAAIKDAMTSTDDQSSDESSGSGSYSTSSRSSSRDSSGTPSRSSSTSSSRSHKPSKKCRKVCVRKKVLWLNESDGRHSLCAGGIARPPGPGLRPPKCVKSVRCLEYKMRCE